MSGKGVTTTGATFLKFLNDDAYWGGEGNTTYYEDTLIMVDGIDCNDYDGEIQAGSKVEFSTGYILSHPTKKDGFLLTTFFKAWLKQQDFISVVVDVPKSREQEFLALMKENGFT